MSTQARKFLRHYKKLFDEISARNQGNNSLSLALDGAQRKTPIIDRMGENVKITGEEDGERYSFAGKKAKTADAYRSATTEKMLNNGIDAETVRKETGWFKGYDGKWRFEIDDSQMKITIPNNKYLTVEQIVSHPKLFEA